ncbi:MAG: cytochrome P450 [Actinobacteria bacterium]|nr:MAG: cytochrome P450 [Actinomycetota bacterium]
MSPAGRCDGEGRCCRSTPRLRHGDPGPRDDAHHGSARRHARQVQRVVRGRHDLEAAVLTRCRHGKPWTAKPLRRATLSEALIDGSPLTDQQIVTQLHFMVQAGVHTTRGLLTHLVERLLLDREIFERLRGERDLVPNFIEESLRHDSPVQRTSRRCTHAVELGGVALAPGDWVEMGIASANRDEAKYADAEAFRLDRPQPRTHLTFGAGSHVCPGATLARLEATVAVEVLLDRVARMDMLDSVHYPPIPGNLGHDPIPARIIAAD